jgi:hypothetical protein
MSGAPWHLLGTTDCPRCGANVPVAELLHSEHRCDPAEIEAHEAEQLRIEAAGIHVEIAEHLGTLAGRKQLAFARWCREHDR